MKNLDTKLNNIPVKIDWNELMLLLVNDLNIPEVSLALRICTKESTLPPKIKLTILQWGKKSLIEKCDPEIHNEDKVFLISFFDNLISLIQRKITLKNSIDAENQNMDQYFV